MTWPIFIFPRMNQVRVFPRLVDGFPVSDDSLKFSRIFNVLLYVVIGSLRSVVFGRMHNSSHSSIKYYCLLPNAA